MRAPFTPPPYPYERLGSLADIARGHEGGMVDCSIGTPSDPPALAVVEALSSSGLERGYPTSAGSSELRAAAARWIARRFGVELPEDAVAASIGSKELVASVAQHLSLRDPTRSVVLYPSISYPSYAMGATLAGLEAVPVPMEAGRLRLDTIDASLADRALLLWSNSPSNPCGMLDDLAAAASWGRERGIPVLSDECYCEFTWSDRPRSILESGLDGVIAVHSLSKRSNLAGLRIGFYAGDPSLVGYLRSLRQHAGLMVPGPVQVAGAIALDDDAQVEVQRERYARRLAMLASALSEAGYPTDLPDGAFYLWVAVPRRLADGWALARELAERAGLLVSPGDLYGPDGADHVRIAVVQPSARLALVARRLAATPLP